VEAVLVPGHTAFHQGVKITSGGRTFFYFGDTVPTSAHVDLAYIMSYDLFPVETFDNKKKLYERAVAEAWIVAFSHDVRHAFGMIRRSSRGYEFQPIDFSGPYFL
jgi:glyoxylase-like metal-dependent hydrolase (beta-lactamase superfamily II)